MAGNSDAENNAGQNDGSGIVGKIIEHMGVSQPRNPANNPVPAYNCPTGTCKTDRVCEGVEKGDTIAPSSRAHIERNSCNECPSSPPVPVYVTKTEMRRYESREVQELIGYADHTGRLWQPDNELTAPIFHGDAGIISGRDYRSMTFRLDRGLSDDERGWQCRYYHGMLDDTSTDMGTYDYADSSITKAVGAMVYLTTDHHDLMDVQPHNSNPNYAPNLTTQY